MFKKNSAKSPYPKQEYHVVIPTQSTTSYQQQAQQGGMFPSSTYNPQLVSTYTYVPQPAMTSQSSSRQLYSQPAAPQVQPTAPPVYGEPPPPYTPYPEKPGNPPQSSSYQLQSSPYPSQLASYPLQHAHYPQQQQTAYPPQQPYNNYPLQGQYSYPTQPLLQTVVVPGGFDAGARFNAGAASTVPPAPLGVAPNAAQMASSQGHSVISTQRHTNWFTGGTGGGPIF